MNEISIARDKNNLGHNNAAALVKKAINMVLEAEGIENACVVSVLFTDDEGIRKLNRDYRDVDSSTDVLSFPMAELVPGGFNPDDCQWDYELDMPILGDVVINLDRCAQQGEELGHGFEREVMYLTVHSILHLLGYDHVDEGEMKAQMRAREKAIMGDE